MDIKEFAHQYLGITIQPHQTTWIDFLEGVEHRGVLMAPRGHGKTTTINYIWLSWVIVNNPDLRILLISHSKEMAESFSRAVRNVMEIPELQHAFGFDTGTPWRSNSWRLMQSPQSKPTLECKGALGRMTGWRGDMVIFDDLLEFSVMNESTTLKLDEWRKQEVLPAIDTHKLDKVIVVGTRKGMDDWYGQLLGSRLYDKHVDTAFLSDDYLEDTEVPTLAPYFYDYEGNIVGPWWNREALLRRRAEIGPLKFAQEYMNQPSPPEGLDFKEAWVKYYEHLPNVYGLKYYMGIDPSSGSKEGSYFAYAVVCQDPNDNKIYVVDLFRDRMSKREQVQKSAQVIAEHAPEAVYIESVFEYTHVYEAMRRLFPNVHSKDYIHTQLKGVKAKKKEERIKEVLGPAFEMGKLYLRRRDLDPHVQTFLDHEYLPFPMGDMDMLDSLVLAVHDIVAVPQIRPGDRLFWSPE